jgi:hypothetical protein
MLVTLYRIKCSGERCGALNRHSMDRDYHVIDGKPGNRRRQTLSYPGRAITLSFIDSASIPYLRGRYGHYQVHNTNPAASA